MASIFNSSSSFFISEASSFISLAFLTSNSIFSSESMRKSSSNSALKVTIKESESFCPVRTTKIFFPSLSKIFSETTFPLRLFTKKILSPSLPSHFSVKALPSLSWIIKTFSSLPPKTFSVRISPSSFLTTTLVLLYPLATLDFV